MVGSAGAWTRADLLEGRLTCTGMRLSPLSVMMVATTAVTVPPAVVPHTAAGRRAHAPWTATRSPGGSR